MESTYEDKSPILEESLGLSQDLIDGLPESDPRTPLSLREIFMPPIFKEILIKGGFWGAIISPMVSFIAAGGIEHPLNVLQNWKQYWVQVLWKIPAVGLVWGLSIGMAGVIFRYCIIPRLDRLKHPLRRGLLISIFAFFTGFITLFTIQMISYFGLRVQTFGGKFGLSEAGIAGLIAVGVCQLLYSQFLNEIRLWDTWQREQALKKHQLEGQLMNLNMRIRPHFFFNVINTLASLIDRDPEHAQEFLADMSDLFRKSFVHGQNSAWCHWSEELDLVEKYLQIEKSRFGDRLKLSIHDQLPGDLRFPAFLLQPLIENAVKYGLKTDLEEVLVEIRTEFRETSWWIQVTNPVIPGARIDIKEGHSLHSILERMDLLEGELLCEIDKGLARMEIAAPND